MSVSEEAMKQLNDVLSRYAHEMREGPTVDLPADMGWQTQGLLNRVQRRMLSEPNLSYVDAVTAVLAEKPELYDGYREENTTRSYGSTEGQH